MALDDQFVAADYAVFGITLAVSLIIGIAASFTGVKVKSAEQYLVGNRRLAVVPVAVSLLMTWISATGILGMTAEMYFFGTQAIMQTVSLVLAAPIPVILIVPLLYQLKLTSTFEYFELRYQSAVLHRFSVVVFFAIAVIGNAIQMYASATALEAVTGISHMYCIGVYGLVVTVYTAIGGIKGVVWTDAFQGIVLLGGLLTMLIAGAIQVGGLAAIWEISDSGQRIKFFDMNPDPTQRVTFWTATFGGFSSVIMYGALDTSAVQRYSAVSSLKKGIWIYILIVPGVLLMEMLIYLTGLTVYAYYAQRGCDPYTGGKIGNSNQILPYYMVDILDVPGLPGLFIAIIFCASMSTSSSTLNGGSAIMYKAFIEPLMNWLETSESKKLVSLKLMVCCYGLVATGVAYGIPHLDGHVVQLAESILGGMSGPLAGAIFLGMLVPFAQWKGATIGSVIGIGFTTWINIGKQLGDDISPHILPLVYNETVCDSLEAFNSSLSDGITATITTLGPSTSTAEDENGHREMFVLYRVSFMYMSVLGFTITFVVGLLASLLTGREKPGAVNPRTIVNWSETIFCRCYSTERRRKMLCGYHGYNQPSEDCDFGKNPDSENEMMSAAEERGLTNATFVKASWAGLKKDDGHEGEAFASTPDEYVTSI